MAEGVFPKPVSLLNSHTKAWRVKDIKEILERIEADEFDIERQVESL